MHRERMADDFGALLETAQLWSGVEERFDFASDDPATFDPVLAAKLNHNAAIAAGKKRVRF